MRRSISIIVFVLLVLCAVAHAQNPFSGSNPFGGAAPTTQQWTGTTTITPTTATEVAAGYTSNVTTGVFQFGTQASEGMRYSPVTGGGRLGIGTTAPAYGVDYTGTTSLRSDVPFTAGDTPTALNFALGDGDTGFYEYSDDLLAISIGGTARFFIQSNVFRTVQNGGGIVNEATSGTNPTLVPYFNETSTGIGDVNADGNTISLIIKSTQVAQANSSGYSVVGALTVLNSGATVTLLSATSTAMLLTPVFATDLNGTGTLRPVVINQTAQIGYDSSTELGKMNWEEIDTSILDLLNPGSYEPKKPKFKGVTTDRIVTDKTADGADVERIVTDTVKVRDGWLEESAGYKRYGLKAEEVAAADKRLVFYGARADGSYGPAGVNYLELVPVLLKKIQEQDAVIASILNRLEKLEAK